MMRTADRAYYQRRAADERAAAEIATNLEAARIHLALAERYAKLAGDDETFKPSAAGARPVAEPDRSAAFAA